jgi:hypothetical protein
MAGRGKSMNSQKTVLVRASISFPPDLYKTLEEIAKQKKVSLATRFRAKTAILVPQLKRYYVAAPRHQKEPAAVKVYEV